VAVGLFAVGLVALLGLFAPVTKSVANVADTEAAAFVADAVRARVQAIAARDFAAAEQLIQDAAAVQQNDASGTYNPNDGVRHPAVIFAKLGGEIGIYDGRRTVRGWYDAANPPAVVADADKFFEVELIRNDTLSPKAADETAVLVVYTLRVRWPSFTPAAGGAAVQVGANPGGGAVTFDHSAKQTLFFTGAITR
jgi:hypothetical protein